MDYVTNQTMLNVWGAVAWCLGGLLTGLAADLAWRFLPARLPEKWRAILTGATVGLGNYLTPLFAMVFFYFPPQTPESHYYLFTSRVIYSLSWLIVNSGFAGYTAYAIRKRI